MILVLARCTSNQLLSHSTATQVMSSTN